MGPVFFLVVRLVHPALPLPPYLLTASGVFVQGRSKGSCVVSHMGRPEVIQRRISDLGLVISTYRSCDVGLVKSYVEYSKTF